MTLCTQAGERRTWWHIRVPDNRQIPPNQGSLMYCGAILLPARCRDGDLQQVDCGDCSRTFGKREAHEHGSLDRGGDVITHLDVAGARVPSR